MKKILFSLLILIFNLNAEMYIKKDSVKKEIAYEYLADKYITSERNIFDESTNIMIKFQNENIELIKIFEEKYNLKLESILRIGYYIYSSDANVIDKINEVIDEDNIKTIFPAWKKTVNRR